MAKHFKFTWFLTGLNDGQINIMVYISIVNSHSR